MSRRKTDMRALNAKVCKSGKEFNDALEGLLNEAGSYANEICRGAAFGLYTELVERTPVDTRRTAAGFIISEEPVETVLPEGDYWDSMNERINENSREWASIPAGRPITISNNTEYLPYLEDGHSKQAPKGFLANSIASWQKKLEKQVAAFNKVKIR